MIVEFQYPGGWARSFGMPIVKMQELAEAIANGGTLKFDVEKGCVVINLALVAIVTVTE